MNVVQLEVLTGKALVAGTEIVLGDTHRLLVCALARCGHAVPREALEALLWPDDAPGRARNLLNIALHRLRKRLGDDAVMQSADGYRLGETVVIDLRQVEALASRLRAAGMADSPKAEQWLPVARRVFCGCRTGACEPEFVAALERRMRCGARVVTERLAEHALGDGRPDLALTLARVLLDEDACDETARTIAIRAHIALGDRPAAIREYRDYTKALTEELGLTPSFALRSLVA